VTSTKSKKAVRALMAETGMKYTTALRLWEADADARRAAYEVTATLGLPEPVREEPQQDPASQMSGGSSALDVRFSHSTGAALEADRPE